MREYEPEELPKELQGGDATVGQELRQFFLDLLQETNLRDYHENRTEYVQRRLGGRAAELLLSEQVTEIERHILAVEGSHRAKPFWVVFPPY